MIAVKLFDNVIFKAIGHDFQSLPFDFPEVLLSKGKLLDVTRLTDHAYWSFVHSFVSLLLGKFAEIPCEQLVL